MTDLSSVELVLLSVFLGVAWGFGSLALLTLWDSFYD